MTHDEYRDHLEEYVFGTLDSPLRAEVERHLDVCQLCRDRVAELARISTMIAERIEQITPPPTIRHTILQKATLDVAPVGTQTTKQIASRSLPSRWPFAFAIAATLLLCVAGALWWQEREVLKSELNASKTEREKLQSELARYEDATLLLGQPGMEFVDLSGVDPNPQAFGKVVVDPINGNGVVYMYKLPPTPEGKAYKMWVMRDGKPTSAGEFTVAADGSAVLKLETIPDFRSIASFQVTIEDAGQAQIPTGMMYLTGLHTQTTN